MTNKAVGVIAALTGAALWGFSGTCSQFLVEHYAISNLFITMVRDVIAGVIFLVVILLKHRSELDTLLHTAWMRRRVVTFALVLYLCQLTYLIAIGYTNAGTATVMQSLNIVMIMIATCFIARRLPHTLELAGLVFAIAATTLIATKGDLSSMSMPPLGFAWGMTTAFFAAAYVMVPQGLMKELGSFTVTGIGMLVASVLAGLVLLLAFAVPSIDVVASAGNTGGSALLPALDAPALGALLVIGVVGTFAAFALFLYGVTLVGSVRGSQLGAVESVSATVCSALFLGTVFTPADWIGLICMVITVVLVAAGRDKNNARFTS